MNKQIIAFGASNSKNSINKMFATYAANQLTGADIKILDLNDFEMQIYSIDRENESGIPNLAKMFHNNIQNADGIIISFAEHNGAYTVSFKNILDWVSRYDNNIWSLHPMFLLGASPGPRGANTVLELAYNRFNRINPNLVVRFSLPSFNNNFSRELGIMDSDLNTHFKEKLNEFKKSL